MRHEAETKSNAYWLGLMAHLQSTSVPRKVELEIFFFCMHDRSFTMLNFPASLTFQVLIFPVFFVYFSSGYFLHQRSDVTIWSCYSPRCIRCIRAFEDRREFIVLLHWNCWVSGRRSCNRWSLVLVWVQSYWMIIIAIINKLSTNLCDIILFSRSHCRGRIGWGLPQCYSSGTRVIHDDTPNNMKLLNGHIA